MQTIQLNMTPHGVMPHLYCSRYDLGRQFGVVIYDDSGTYNIPAGAVATLRGTKPDGRQIAYGSADKEPKVAVSGNEIVITSTEQMTSSTGKVICELELDSGNQILASLNFIIVVEEGAMAEDEKASVSDLETYQEMIDDAKEAQAVGEDAMAIVKAYGLHAVETTLLASKWVGDAEPFEYDLGSDYKGMVAYIVPTKDATDAQLETWRNARIYGDLNSTKIYAKMAKPLLDIPVDIIYTGISTGGDK